MLNKSSSAAQTTKPPSLKVTSSFSLLPYDDGSIFVFKQDGTRSHIYHLQLGSQSSLAAIRNVISVGPGPSPRVANGAVMVGSSLMVIWGGQVHDASGQSQLACSDSDIHIFNISEF